MVRRAPGGRIGPALLLACVFAGMPAAASPREELGQYTLRAAELEKLVEGEAIGEEVGTLRAWVAEAQARLDAGDPDALARSLDRVRAQAALVEVLIERRKADMAERTARAAAEAEERTAQEARRRAEERERTLRVLEQAPPEAPGTSP
ncbi:MAG: hypothetical protein R3F60_29890 [bacterium]